MMLGDEVSVLASIQGPDSSSLHVGGEVVVVADSYWGEKVVGTEGQA
jgi:hypothetical protein